MANSDKNIIITPNIGSVNDPKIVFSGADASTAAQNITLTAYPTNGGTLSFDGSTGQLFSVTNSMSGTIFSVNDVSGIPSIEVIDTGLVKIAQYSGNVLLGTGTDTGLAKLQVTGSLSLTGNILHSPTGRSIYGPNTSWSSYLYVGGDGTNGITRTGSIASVVTTNGNLHLDSGSDKGMYLNYYSGTGGIQFGNGATGVTATLTAAGVFNGTNVTVNGNQTLHAGNYTSYSPTLTGGSASGTWGISITGSAATATDSTKVAKSGDTMTGALTLSNTGLFLNRSSGASTGISWYSSSYTTWSTYMAAAAATSVGPTGNITAPTGTLVTSWALRNFVENPAGYGWTWESGAATGQPSVVAEIRSSDGAMRIAGAFTAVGTITGSNLSGTNTGDNAGVTSVATSGGYGGLTLTGGTITTTGTITMGGTPTGTWPISITGSAATATDNTKLPLTGGTMTGGGRIDWASGAGGATFGSNHYAIGRDNADGGWNHPYPDLIIGYHTGIRIGALSSYKGTRFYNNSPTTDANNDGHGDQGEIQLLTIGDGDDGIRKGPVGSAYTVPFVALQDTAPTAIQSGDMWWQSSTGKLKIYYNDGNTSQWVDAVPIPDTSTFYSKAGGGITGPVVVNSSLTVTGTSYLTGLTATNTITGSISGNAATVTSWQSITNRVSFDYNLAGRTNGSYACDGGGTNGPGSNYLNLIHQVGSGDVGFQIAGGYTSDQMYFRGSSAVQSGTGYTAWRTVLHNGNYTSYSPSLTGGSASGTWGISITGNSATTSQTTFGEVYSNGWLRNNNNNTGLYNTANGNHFYSRAANRWGITGNAAGSNIYLDFYGTHENTIRGSIHADTSNNIGFLTPGSSWSFMVSSTGNATATLNVTAYSDERLKKDWVDLPNTFVEQLSKVKSGTYTRIDTNIRQAGSSAQDWQKLLPEVVVVTDDEDKTLSLAYGNAALVSAVELAKKVVSLNARIARLEALVLKLIEG